MNDRAFEHYDTYYHRGTAYRDSKILTLEELARDRAPRWLNRVPKDAHILDYGCADGYTLWMLHTLGYRNLVGADISESVLRHARTRLAGTGVELRHVTPDTFDDCTDRFDVIVMHHVLEHIPRQDAISTLSRLHALLKADGLISIAVPNASSFVGIVTHAGDFTHHVLYNEHSLRQVLESSGFDGVELIYHPPPLYFSLTRPLKMAARLLSFGQYHLNNALYRSIHFLGDQRPRSSCFERSVEFVARRPAAENGP